MKIYTKSGDDGTTGLFAGPRVSKDHPRLEAYGTVDELNAVLGIVIAQLDLAGSSVRGDEQAERSAASAADQLRAVQADLFSIGAQLATPDPEPHGMCLLSATRVGQIESLIDEIDGQLTPLKSFVLPGGTMGSAMLHLARTVCRRAERNLVGLAKKSDIHGGDLPLIYLNRLSDLLFVLARKANAEAGVCDRAWQPPKSG